jgi:hypothetical protein
MITSDNIVIKNDDNNDIFRLTPNQTCVKLKMPPGALTPSGRGNPPAFVQKICLRRDLQSLRRLSIIHA